MRVLRGSCLYGAVAYAAGAPTGLALGAHFWVREKGVYYDIGGPLPQFQEG